MENQLVVKSLITESHTPLGETFVERIIKALRDHPKMTGYQVSEGIYSSTESITLDVDKDTKIEIRLNVSK